MKRPRRNRYAKSAKVSPYRLLRLMSCYAQDVPVRTAAQLLKLSERTVRDRYSEWRERLLPWAIAHPDRFNGFGHLLLDADGSLNRMMLEVMLWYAGTLSFKAHMQARYPRWNPKTDPVLPYVLEHALRRFCAMEPPSVTDDFRAMVSRAFMAARSESLLVEQKRAAGVHAARQWYWLVASRRLQGEASARIRRHPGAGERFLRDLRWLLIREPL